MAKMYEQEKIEFNYIHNAPIKVVVVKKIPCSPAALFRSFEDGEAWKSWLLMSEVLWTSPLPFGTGTTRTIQLANLRVEEHFFFWEHEHQMAFRFERSTAKYFTAFMEHYAVKDLGQNHCELTWSIGLGLQSPLSVFGPLLGLGMKLSGHLILGRLASYMAKNPSKYLS